MKIYNSDNHVKNLPDAYRKTADSNNYKILEIERLEVNNFRQTLQEIFDSLDINNASNTTLDLYGDMVGQARGTATDGQYILMIKAKIMQNISNGSYPSIVKAICMTFDCEPSEVYIVEEAEPCKVKIIALPLAVINHAGLNTRQTLDLIKHLLPTGITLTSFLFEGTFTFAGTENDYDITAGFCDIEGGTIGGYLGATSGDENEQDIPI